MTTVAADTIPGLDDSTLTRALYSTDASLYRVVPQGVAHPRTVGELEAVVDAARAARVPLTTRGAGTSCAGNAVGPGVVVDVARHLTAIHAIDAGRRGQHALEPQVAAFAIQCDGDAEAEQARAGHPEDAIGG